MIYQRLRQGQKLLLFLGFTFWNYAFRSEQSDKSWIV